MSSKRRSASDQPRARSERENSTAREARSQGCRVSIIGGASDARCRWDASSTTSLCIHCGESSVRERLAPHTSHSGREMSRRTDEKVRCRSRMGAAQQKRVISMQCSGAIKSFIHDNPESSTDHAAPAPDAPCERYLVIFNASWWM